MPTWVAVSKLTTLTLPPAEPHQYHYTRIMSDYWVSKKKYFCKYCDIFIADDAPSRQQHENGLRHKGNKDRFIRDLYKNGEKRKKDKQDEDREMKVIEQAAQAAYAKDVGHVAAAAAVASSSTAPPRPPPPKGPVSGDKWANYSTAASLGIVDLEADRIAAEAAIRQNEGRIGQWSTVALIPTAPASAADVESSAASSSIAKRPREPSPVDDDPEDTRKFKVRQKAAQVGLGADLYVPGEIRVKRKEDGTAAPKVEENNGPQASLLPEWRPTQWRRAGDPGEGVKTEDGAGEVGHEADEPMIAVKAEPLDTIGLDQQPEPTPAPAFKIEQTTDEKPLLEPSSDSNAGGLFKKRKIKSSTQGGRRPL